MKAGIKYYILVPGFLIALYFPLLNKVTNLLPDVQGTENRQMKAFPKLDTCPPDKVFAYLEDYLVDRISVRNRLISFYNKLNIFVFKSSPVSIKAIVGKNGWFFMAGEEVKTYNGTSLFTKAELRKLEEELWRRKKFVESHQGHFFFAIVPNKSNVYPEYMPDYLLSAEGYGKQLMEVLKKDSFPVIDLYAPLLQAKGAHDLYYQTDNHWNDLGAFVAANAVLKEFKSHYPLVEVPDTIAYPLRKVTEPAGNIAKMFSLDQERQEINYIPTPPGGLKSYEKKLNKYPVTGGFAYPEEHELTRYTNRQELPVVLIIRDSFGAKLFPYLAEQSGRCTAIYDAWHYGLNEPVIQGEKPDLVLLLVVESNLRNIMKYQSQ